MKLRKALLVSFCILLVFAGCTDRAPFILVTGGVNQGNKVPSDIETAMSIDLSTIAEDVLKGNSQLEVSWHDTDPSSAISSNSIPVQKKIYADVSFKDYDNAISSSAIRSINGGRVIFTFDYSEGNDGNIEINGYSAVTISSPTINFNDHAKTEKSLTIEISAGAIEASARISGSGSIDFTIVSVISVSIPTGTIKIDESEMKIEDVVPEAIGKTLGFSGGSGTAEDPIPINDADDLRHLSDLVGGRAVIDGQQMEAVSFRGMHFSQTADIDLSGEPWIPIGGVGSTGGSNVVNPFLGSYNGNNRRITGLSIDSDQYHFAGLFGAVAGMDDGISFSNIIIEGTITVVKPSTSQAASACTAGLVAGTASGKVSFIECYAGSSGSSSSVTAERAGGIVGEAEGAAKGDVIISDCYNWATITGRKDDGSSASQYAGGILGSTSNSEISGCCNYGKITSSMLTGGIIGIASSADVSTSHNYGVVEGTGSSTGGIAASITNGSITSSVNHVSISTTKTQIGGIVGVSTNSAIEGCSVAKTDGAGDLTITGRSTVGGIVGLLERSSISGETENGADRIVATTNSGIAGGIAGDMQSGSSITGAVNRAAVGCGSDLTGQIFYFGGIVGKSAASSISDSDNYGAIGNEVAGSPYGVGGIAGAVTSAVGTGYDISNCENHGSVTGGYWTGGIVGNIKEGVKIDSSANFSAIAAKGSSTGGIVGLSEGGEISSGSNHASVSGAALTGGIVGYVDSGKVTDCDLVAVSSLEISGSGSVGGIVGRVAGEGVISSCDTPAPAAIKCTGQYNGGIAGAVLNGAKIENCNNSADVISEGTGETYHAGGVAGLISYNINETAYTGSAVCSINNSTSKDTTIKASYFVGGIVGSVYEAADISTCTVESLVLEGGNAGYIIGQTQTSENNPEAIKSKKITISGCSETGTASGKQVIGARNGFGDDKIIITN